MKIRLIKPVAVASTKSITCATINWIEIQSEFD
jgi:hypothetical protein